MSLEWKMYHWKWQSDLIKPSYFFDLTYRTFCSILVILLKDKAPFKKEIIEEVLNIWDNTTFKQKFSFIVVFLNIFLDLLQFIVYYICLPFRIFSEWFCNLGRDL